MTRAPAAPPSSDERDCYCSLWQSKPSVLEAQGLSPGYCGRCMTCGEPGHLRHHPGAVPFTGAWCDRHYRRLAWLHPLAWRGTLLWLGTVLVLIGAWYLRR
jgi:hypothetical protein